MISRPTKTKEIVALPHDNTDLLTFRLKELEAKVHQLQQTADSRYGKMKWQLDGLQNQLSTATLWAKEAAKNTYSKAHHHWLAASVILNLVLLLVLGILTHWN